MLTRDSITKASMMMLPAYPILAGAQGLAYTLGDPARTNTPSFEAAKHLLPMRMWGVVFLGLALVMVVGYAMRSRDVTVFVLFSAAMAYSMWSGAFWVALLTVDDASLMAPAWPLFAAWCCFVSASSVARREISIRRDPE
jgi:hypothetical protein